MIKFERIISSTTATAIIDSLFNIQNSKMIKSRDRSSRAKNRRQKRNLHIDTKVKTVIARKRAFKNSTLRQLSQFERLQIKATMSNAMNSKTTLVVHRADSVSDRKRDKERE